MDRTRFLLTPRVWIYQSRCGLPSRISKAHQDPRSRPIARRFSSPAPLSSDPAGTDDDGENDGDRQRVAVAHFAMGESDGKFMDYSKSWAWQQVLLHRRMEAQRYPSTSDAHVNDDRDTVLFIEHNPVYTLGRGADEGHLVFLKDDHQENENIRAKLSRKARGAQSARLAVDRHRDATAMALPVREAVDRLSATANPVYTPNKSVPIYRVERGGEVTFHGPSQLVVYPLLDLRQHPFQKDLHWYLRQVEEVVIQTLKRYDIESVRDEENTGVWVGDHKIAAVGVSASRWITTHGFALNVDPDLSYFDTSVILPCGIEGRGVTSMAQIFKERYEGGKDLTVPTVPEVAATVVEVMEEVFQITLKKGGGL